MYLMVFENIWRCLGDVLEYYCFFERGELGEVYYYLYGIFFFFISLSLYSFSECVS